MEPSWPVFMACRRSNASGPRHLADDDPVRPHAQTVFYKIAHGDLALAFQVRRPGLKAHDMWLLELQLGGVLTGDDPLFLVDVPRQAVQQGRFTRARCLRR